MKNILKMIINPFRLLLGLLVYLFFTKKTNFGYQGLVGSFCDTRGVSTRVLHKIISFFKRPYTFSEKISGVLGELEDSKVEKIAQEIEKKGYYVFENRLSEESCSELLKFALETEAVVRPDKNFDNSVTSVKQLERQKIDRDNPIVIRYDFLTEDLLKNEEVQKLLADISLIAVAQEYLQCKPKSDVLGMWWHTSFSKEENPSAATMYHFDLDRIKWLKFFFYLTDTTKETGAHQFIEGSHNGNIPYKFLKRGYVRLKSSEVLEHYGEDKEITYEAPKGTIIAEDTSGLHRGNPVRRDDRLLFQIQFSDTLFGAESPVSRFDKDKLHPFLSNRIEKYPDIYERYITDKFQYKG